MKFHSSANHFARTCFWPLLIVDPSSHPIRAFHRSRFFHANRFFFFLSFFVQLSTTKEDQEEIARKDAEDKGTQ